MKSKFFYICVAEFETELPLTRMPETYFPKVIEGTLKFKHSLDMVDGYHIPTNIEIFVKDKTK